MPSSLSIGEEVIGANTGAVEDVFRSWLAAVREELRILNDKAGSSKLLPGRLVTGMRVQIEDGFIQEHFDLGCSAKDTASDVLWLIGS